MSEVDGIQVWVAGSAVLSIQSQTDAEGQVTATANIAIQRSMALSRRSH